MCPDGTETRLLAAARLCVKRLDHFADQVDWKQIVVRKDQIALWPAIRFEASDEVSRSPDGREDADMLLEAGKEEKDLSRPISGHLITYATLRSWNPLFYFGLDALKSNSHLRFCRGKVIFVSGYHVLLSLCRRLLGELNSR
jgi:hypothetical protein